MSAQTQTDQLLQFFKIIGNESRLKVLGLLASDERSVGELAILLGLSEPTISHHLAVLRELDLVAMRVDGNNHIYWLNTTALETLNRNIFSQEQLASLAPEESGRAWEAKVLRYYLVDGRLRAIPATQKKRQIVLRWLADQFEKGQDLPEVELNKRLKTFHPDVAALRRHLVEFKLMERKNNLYRRL